MPSVEIEDERFSSLACQNRLVVHAALHAAALGAPHEAILVAPGAGVHGDPNDPARQVRAAARQGDLNVFANSHAGELRDNRLLFRRDRDVQLGDAAI